MKVGIVTHILYHNYGGCLQTYALQKVLRQMGHEPVTIDYLPDLETKTKYFLAQCKTLCYYMLLQRSRHFYKYPKRKRCPQFAKFMQKHLSLTHRVKRYKSSIIREYNIEALVVGSDQVWRSSYYPHHILPDLYLRFAERYRIPKIAYAASFGIGWWEYSGELTKECSKYAQVFTAISTREDSGVELCNKYLDVDAVGVSDPTLLLEKEDYMAICESIPRHDENYILAYLLDITPELKEAVAQFARNANLPVFFFISEKDVILSVEEWLAMFRDASFVVTNSFHGTAFSIINNKDFYSVVHADRGGDRFYSLLNRFHLSDRLIESGEPFPSDIPNIDWEAVNDIRRRWKNEGLGFLRESLKK